VGFSHGRIESVGSKRVVTGEVCAAGGGDDGGVELGDDPEERRRLPWLAMRASLYRPAALPHLVTRS
jgi:hypothetical protein